MIIAPYSFNRRPYAIISPFQMIQTKPFHSSLPFRKNTRQKYYEADPFWETNKLKVLVSNGQSKEAKELFSSKHNADGVDYSYMLRLLVQVSSKLFSAFLFVLYIVQSNFLKGGELWRHSANAGRD